MNFKAALLVTLVGIVASASISKKPDIMNKNTIEKAHNLINKIINDISTTHAAWISIKSMTLGNSNTRQELDFLKKDMNIPSAPVLQEISTISSMESCLANITKGLQLHLNLLKEISKATTLPQTDQAKDLQATMKELLNLIEELQKQAGFDSSDQASDEQSKTPDLVKHLKGDFNTQAAAHLILQQLQDFSCSMLHSILSMSSSITKNPHTMKHCVNAGL